MADVDPTLSTDQPQTDAPVTPEPATEPTPPTAQEVEQAAQPSIPTPRNAETLFSDFLAGKAIEEHPLIRIELSPMVIKKMEDGGVVISPSNQIIVNYQ